MKTTRKITNFLSIIGATIALFVFFSHTGAALGDQGQEGERAYALFNRMASSDSVQYSAIYTIENFEQDEEEDRKRAYRIIRMGPDKGWWQKVESGENKRMYILLDNVYYESLGGRESVRIWRRRSRRGIYDVNNIALILNNYYVRFVSDEHVQDYPVDVVEISPKQKDRSWRKIWVHKINGFIFRTEVYDLDDNIVFRRSGKDVIFNPRIDPGLFEIKRKDELPSEREKRERKVYDNIGDVREELGIPLIAPSVQPPGFVLNEIAVTYDRDVPIVQLYYTDGILSFSLFQRETRRDNRKMRIGRDHGELYMSAINNRIYYRYEGDIDNIARETMVKSFESIELVRKD